MTNNQIQYWRNVEAERTNKAKETETYRANRAAEQELSRHNVEMEKLQRQSNRTNLYAATTSAYHQMRQLSEQNRANVAREQENVAQRSANYALGVRNAGIAQFNAETNRLVNAETNRSNLAREKFNLTNLAEIGRANLASEAIRTATNRVTQQRNVNEYNLNLRKQSEYERQNKAQNAIQMRGQNFQLVSNLANTLSNASISALRKFRR